MKHNTTIAQLMKTLPQTGRVEWIGLRPARKQNMISVASAELDAGGLVGDRYAGSSGNRALTLIQAEHLPVIASVLHLERVLPEMLRRNVVISGINLLALKNHRFMLGSAVLEMSGLCHPCSRMEEIFGEGGYNAVRGHGGITARIVTPGSFQLGDSLSVLE